VPAGGAALLEAELRGLAASPAAPGAADLLAEAEKAIWEPPAREEELEEADTADSGLNAMTLGLAVAEASSDEPVAASMPLGLDDVKKRPSVPIATAGSVALPVADAEESVEDEIPDALAEAEKPPKVPVAAAGPDGLEEAEAPPNVPCALAEG
jgi:hypothetical protein